MNQLVIKNLVKKYNDKKIVDNLNMIINQGEFVAFLGTNGAGKSTTIKMLTGELIPDSGSIQLDQEKYNSTNYRSKIGIVFQNSVLDEELTVYMNLYLRAKMYRKFDGKWFKKVINLFELEKILNSNYGSLSGGQKRSVDIARAIISKPEILILDEPSTGLDVKNRKLIWNTILQIKNIYNLTIILTTHYLEEAEYATKIHILDAGKLIITSTTAELRQKYMVGTLCLNLKNNQVLSLDLNKYQYFRDKALVKIKTNNLQDILKILNANNDNLLNFEYHAGSLNDVFLAITAKVD